ncbi:dicarboxylate/amino acid:cation symporter [Luteimonas aquatica]|uniref:dicarboxylate/amino acid:cation symporter n=1 Tax=Luteimonas aquatica TaxID=450364 RepID=UPI001F5753CC|nr:dicarboxylate/amino acid:cation symporter [Luteimonas aquatica]
MLKTDHAAAAPPAPVPFYRHLYFQVIVAIVLGAVLGHFEPAFAVQLKPLGDAFIKVVKMIIVPVIFLTIVVGIASMTSMKAVGRVMLKAMAYFLVLSTLALVIGLVIAHVVQPGAGMNINPEELKAGAGDVAKYASDAHAIAEKMSLVAFLMDIIPDTVVGAFAEGKVLQVLFFAIVFGIALAQVGKAGEPILKFLEALTWPVFRLVAILMKFAPIGAFGAIAFTIGKYGLGALTHLAWLVGSFYIGSLLFVLLVLGLVARLSGFSILGLLRYLKSELLLVLGTSSSEAALPALMQKMERAGCGKSVVGLVVPTGYSFNLDGTNLYMTLAALFIAQATNTHLSLEQQIALLLVAMVSSKGAAGVTGAGFVTLAMTLQVVPTIPIAGMALILGVDRFMSECRALTNFIGNAVATVVVSRWEGALDRDRLEAALGGRELPMPELNEPSLPT